MDVLLLSIAKVSCKCTATRAGVDKNISGNNASVGSIGKYVQECGLASTRYALVWSEETKPQGHQRTINAVTVPGETQPSKP